MPVLAQGASCFQNGFIYDVGAGGCENKTLPPAANNTQATGSSMESSPVSTNRFCLPNTPAAFQKQMDV